MLICDTKYACPAPNASSPSGFSCILYLSFFFDSKIENDLPVLEMITVPCAEFYKKLFFIEIFHEVNTFTTTFLLWQDSEYKSKSRPGLPSLLCVRYWPDTSISLEDRIKYKFKYLRQILEYFNLFHTEICLIHLGINLFAKISTVHTLCQIFSCMQNYLFSSS